MRRIRGKFFPRGFLAAYETKWNADFARFVEINTGIMGFTRLLKQVNIRLKITVHTFTKYIVLYCC